METILIVDDELIVLEQLTEIFKQYGYLVYPVDKGQQALEIMKKIVPDLIILDVVLPDINGIDVLHHCSQYYPNLPVVMISGKADFHQAITALTSGAVDYISKPFFEDDLLLAVNRALGKFVPVVNPIRN